MTVGTRLLLGIAALAAGVSALVVVVLLARSILG
jgi:hypothetical protein